MGVEGTLEERGDIPLLDQLLESHGVCLEQLLSILEAELYWVIPATKWVVQAGLVRPQVHQHLPSALILHGQTLPAGHMTVT